MYFMDYARYDLAMTASPPRSQSRFGVQPARAAIRQAGYTITQAAEAMDINRTHLNNAVLGKISPSQQLRVSLPRLLGRGLQELFTHDSLAAQYGSSSARPGRSFGFDEPVMRSTRHKK